MVCLSGQDIRRIRSSDVHLLQLVHAKHLTSPEIFHLRLRQAGLSGVVFEPGLPVRAVVGQQQQIVLDVALAVEGVGHVARELVQLRAAYRADAGREGQGRRVARRGRGRCRVVRAVARWRLEGGQA